MDRRLSHMSQMAVVASWGEAHSKHEQLTQSRSRPLKLVFPHVG